MFVCALNDVICEYHCLLLNYLVMLLRIDALGSRHQIKLSMHLKTKHESYIL